MKNDLLICECNSNEHQIIITKIDGKIYATIHLKKISFFKRIVHGIKYIFGYKCKYGNFEEFILTSEHIAKINTMVSDVKYSKE